MNILLDIKNLHASIDDTQILNGVDLSIGSSATHALMGPNGSGKSTFAQVLAGYPNYKITEGSVEFDNSNLLELSPDERARAGIFLAFQYPVAVPGVPVLSMLRAAYNALRPASPELQRGEQAQGKLTVAKFRKLLNEQAEKLRIDLEFIDRPVNDGFSGGEKKKFEILQMAVLKPRMIILDETDSGLDVDALQIVANAVNDYKKENPETGILIITHYQRILHYIKPDHLHVMFDGRIVKSGDHKLAEELEKQGYENLNNNHD